MRTKNFYFEEIHWQIALCLDSIASHMKHLKNRYTFNNAQARINETKNIIERIINKKKELNNSFVASQDLKTFQYKINHDYDLAVDILDEKLLRFWRFYFEDKFIQIAKLGSFQK